MKYQKKRSAIILLADGTIFHGKAVGDKAGTAFGEVCFNTGMTGYQEIFTDPSYFGQLMVTTNAHIGNYGTNPNEVESDGVKIAGLICKNFSYEFSRTDATASLEDYLNDHKLFAISDVDTRALVSYIRDHGAMNAVISTRVDEIDALKSELSKVPSMQGLALAGEVSTKEPYVIGNPESSFKVAGLRYWD
jgi:carbamoyl-phosphate synthase small subunit